MTLMEEKQSKLLEMTNSMNTRHVKLAVSLFFGNTFEQAYVDAGYKSKSPKRNAVKLITSNRQIVSYVNLLVEVERMIRNQADLIADIVASKSSSDAFVMLQGMATYEDWKRANPYKATITEKAFGDSEDYFNQLREALIELSGQSPGMESVRHG